MKDTIYYQTEEYDYVEIESSGVLESLEITRNQLRTLAGVRYKVIDRYYKGEDVYMVDLSFLTKICYSLKYKMGDLLEYCSPNSENK